MNENSFIQKITKGILRNRKKAILDRNIMHPVREWFLGLSIGLIILSVGIFWSVSTYYRFSHIKVSNETSEKEEVIYRASMVDTALADFAARKQTYNGLKTQLLNKYQKEVVVEAEPVVEISTSTEAVPVVLEGESTEEEAVSEVGEIKFE